MLPHPETDADDSSGARRARRALAVAMSVALAAVVSGVVLVGWLGSDSSGRTDAENAALTGPAKGGAWADESRSAPAAGRPVPLAEVTDGTAPAAGPGGGLPAQPVAPGPGTPPGGGNGEPPPQPLANPAPPPPPAADLNAGCRPPGRHGVDIQRDEAGRVTLVTVSGFDVPCVGAPFDVVLDIRGDAPDVEVTVEVTQDRLLRFAPDRPVEVRDVQGVTLRRAG